MQDEIARIQSLSTTPRYNIKAVVQQTQLNISTLRAWEQRYGVPSPMRSPHGHRLYSARDIAVVTWLKRSTEQGIAISQAVALLHESRAEANAELAPERGVLPTGSGMAQMRERLLESLLNVNLREAHLLVNTACAMFPVETMIVDLFQPIQIAMGERWARGEICGAEERVATNFIRQRIHALMQVHAPFAHGPRLICGCAPEEQHELGLLMFALLMEQRGWETIYLGPNLAREGLAPFLKRLAPAIVFFSVTMAEHASGLLSLCQIVHGLDPQRLVLTYGGRLFASNPELRQRFPGTYLGNDLREAAARTAELGQQIEGERWANHDFAGSARI